MQCGFDFKQWHTAVALNITYLNMNEATRERLFGWRHAVDHPVTLWITLALAVVLLVVPAVVLWLSRSRRIDEMMRRELWLRYFTWLVLIPLMIGPPLAGAFWTVLTVTALGIGCYVEFARNTPLSKQLPLNAVAILGIIAINFGALDHWWELFTAAFPVTICLVAIVALLPDKPEGYLQRVALAALAFALFGAGLGHLSYLANDAGYRPVLILLLLSVELNDVLAFMCGKLFGRRKLAPQTSPGKTLGGSLGALVLSSLLFAAIGQFVFTEPPLNHPAHLLTMGLLVSLLGQLGDLMLSSVKRDIGIKDMGALLPGHGGLLDRFDSLILVAPAMFYYIGFFQGLGMDEPLRIFTSAGS